MPVPHIIIDDFLPDPDTYRAEVLKLPYCEIRGPDGVVYRNICVRPTTEHKEKIEDAIGKTINQRYSFLRYAIYASTCENPFHADGIYGEYAGLLYLNTPDQIVPGSGTSFYRHRKLGMEKMLTAEEIRAKGKSPKRVFSELGKSWSDESAWKRTAHVDMKFNRFVAYPGDYFHARQPFQAFGNTIEDARLIFCTFFSV